MSLNIRDLTRVVLVKHSVNIWLQLLVVALFLNVRSDVLFSVKTTNVRKLCEPRENPAPVIHPQSVGHFMNIKLYLQEL